MVKCVCLSTVRFAMTENSLAVSVPYSYSCKRSPKDAEDQIEAAIGASQALRHVHGTQFDVGSLCSNLYPAHGNVLDWMYAREAVKYSYVAHLRDTGTVRVFTSSSPIITDASVVWIFITRE